MRLSELLGRGPSRNATHIDDLGHLRYGKGDELPAGGCASIWCPDGKYHCGFCNLSWLPQPGMLPPCMMSRSEYEWRKD